MNSNTAAGKKGIKPSEYLCIWCDACFKHKETEELYCPSCNNRTDLVPIYVENNPQEEAMLTKNDFQGG